MLMTQQRAVVHRSWERGGTQHAASRGPRLRSWHGCGPLARHICLTPASLPSSAHPCLAALPVQHALRGFGLSAYEALRKHNVKVCATCCAMHAVRCMLCCVCTACCRAHKQPEGLEAATGADGELWGRQLACHAMPCCIARCTSPSLPLFGIPRCRPDPTGAGG